MHFTSNESNLIYVHHHEPKKKYTYNIKKSYWFNYGHFLNDSFSNTRQLYTNSLVIYLLKDVLEPTIISLQDCVLCAERKTDTTRGMRAQYTCKCTVAIVTARYMYHSLGQVFHADMTV